MNKNIIFTIIPKGYFIIFAISIIFLIIGGKYLEPANLGFNILILLIGLKLAIFVHEIGHLLFAWVVGANPRRLILGKGHKVAETKFKGIKIILNNNLNSGFAYAAFDNLNFIRLKLFFYISGGFLVNFSIAYILFLVFGFSIKMSNTIQFSTAILLANLITGMSALIPRYSNYQGLRLYSDGLSLLRIPFHKKSKLLELSSANELLDAFELFESRKYEESIKVYETFKKKNKGSKVVNLNLSLAYMKVGNFKKAIELMEELLPLIEDNSFKSFKAIIYNVIAWEYLLVNRFNEADRYSELAYKIAPKDLNIIGTRASVLIEKGKFKEGKNLLINDIDFNFPNCQTLSASIYVGLALHNLNEHKEAKRYMNFVENNLNLLDIDEFTLYERTKKSINKIVNTNNKNLEIDLII